MQDVMMEWTCRYNCGDKRCVGNFSAEISREVVELEYQKGNEILLTWILGHRFWE
jgi:hypothetical protein